MSLHGNGGEDGGLLRCVGRLNELIQPVGTPFSKRSAALLQLHNKSENTAAQCGSVHECQGAALQWQSCARRKVLGRQQLQMKRVRPHCDLLAASFHTVS